MVHATSNLALDYAHIIPQLLHNDRFTSNANITCAKNHKCYTMTHLQVMPTLLVQKTMYYYDVKHFLLLLAQIL